MRIDRNAVHAKAREVEGLLPHLNAVADVRAGGAVALYQEGLSPVMVATAVQVVEQLAGASGMSMEAVAAVLQVNPQLPAMNLTNLDGFIASFPEAAENESPFVREHVLGALSGYFSRELLDDEGCQQFMVRVAEHAVREAQREVQVGPGADLPATVPAGGALTVDLVRACMQGLANITTQAGLASVQQGLQMLYNGGASFGTPLAALESCVRQAYPGAGAVEVGRLSRQAADYLGRFSRDLGQGVMVDMGRAWLRDNEAALIEEARALEAEHELEVGEFANGGLGGDERIALPAPEAYAEEEELSFGDDCFSMDR